MPITFRALCFLACAAQSLAPVAAMAVWSLPATAAEEEATAVQGAAQLGSLAIEGAYARAMPPRAANGAAFLSITNHGAEADRLLGATSPLAGAVELHETVMEGDVMRMRPLGDGIALPPGETVSLAPGGMHLMFLQVEQRFTEGQTVPVFLHFDRSPTIELQLPVAALGAAAPAAAGAHAGH